LGPLIIEKNTIFPKKTRKNANLQFFAQKKNDKKRKFRHFDQKSTFWPKIVDFAKKPPFLAKNKHGSGSYCTLMKMSLL
jgi:hypothetical protein